MLVHGQQLVDPAQQHRIAPDRKLEVVDLELGAAGALGGSDGPEARLDDEVRRDLVEDPDRLRQGLLVVAVGVQGLSYWDRGQSVILAGVVGTVWGLWGFTFGFEVHLAFVAGRTGTYFGHVDAGTAR